MSTSSVVDMAATRPDHRGKAACLIDQGGQLPVQAVPTGSIHRPIPLGVGRALSHEHSPKQRTTFSDLPAEIRNLIWNAALVPRLIVLKLKERTTKSDSPNNIDFDNIPGMFFANRESRTIALHHYDQIFTVSITKSIKLLTRDGFRWDSHVMCRIPVVMSAIDEIAFSMSQIRDYIGYYHLAVSIDAAAGAPTPYIQRLSLLHDSLMRPGIDTEHLARLLNPSCPEWDASDSTTYDHGMKSMTWKPFIQWPKLSLSEKYLRQWETLRLKFVTGRRGNIDRWLSSGFIGWSQGAILSMGDGDLGACVVSFAHPDEPDEAEDGW